MLALSESDRKLVELAQSGSHQAFDRLVALHQDRVFKLAYRILGNTEEAADIQQETFLNAWRALRKFRGKSSLATWLHRITVNLCLSRKRKRDWDELSYSDEIMPEAATPGCAERTETRMIVRKALITLPKHHRAFIVLREIEERPFDEIAQVMGCSVQSARVRASKARQILRERLAPLLTGEEL